MLPIPGEFTFPILWWVAVSFISSWGMVLMLMHVFCLSLNALSSLPRPLTCQVLLNLFCSSGFVFTEEFWHGLCFSCPGAVCKCWRRGWKSEGVCFVMLAAAFQGCLLLGAGRVQLSPELSAHYLVWKLQLGSLSCQKLPDFQNGFFVWLKTYFKTSLQEVCVTL